MTFPALTFYDAGECRESNRKLALAKMEQLCHFCSFFNRSHLNYLEHISMLRSNYRISEFFFFFFLLLLLLLESNLFCSLPRVETFNAGHIFMSVFRREI